MKLTSLLSVVFAFAAIGFGLAFLFLGIPLERMGALVIGGFVLAAAFFSSPEFVNGWIQKALDHLPSFGGRSSPPADPPAGGGA